MLEEHNRLNRSASIKYILRNGSRVFASEFVVNWVKVRDQEFRCAFIASKKVGNAVKRNRATRILRESVRVLILEGKVPIGIHMVIVASPAIADKTSIEITNILRKKMPFIVI